MKAYIGKEYVQLYLDYLTHCGADVEHSQWMKNHKDKVNSGETVPFFNSGITVRVQRHHR